MIVSSSAGPTGKPLLDTLTGRKASRLPFWLMRQAGRYLPEYRAVRADAGSFLDLCLAPDKAAEVTLQPIRRYHMDGAILFSDILIVPFGLGQDLAFREGEGPVLTPLRQVSDLDRLSPRQFHDRVGPVYETVRRVRAALPDDVTFLGFAGSPWTVASYMVEGRTSRDFEQIKRFAFGDPIGFQVLIDHVVHATTEYLVAQIDAGVEVVQLFDSWCGVLSDDAFDRWVIKPNKAIVDGVRAQRPGIPVIAFPRGAGLSYRRFVDEVKPDGLGLDTTVPMDAAVELQKTVPVQGNLDPIVLLTGGDALRTGVQRILSALGSGPFIFNLGHGVVPETPPEHVALVTELIRRHGQNGSPPHIG